MTITKGIQSILKEVFGYTSFRSLQEECIQSVLNKQDSLLIMSTGGGKSLCYQIPALMFPGLTVVVSPLISLMKDQVSQLKGLGVEAEFLNSTLSWEEYEQNMAAVSCGQTKLLFLAPETLVKNDVLQMLSAISVDCLTIDEAHCISDWGHDFRPDYRTIKDVRKNFPDAVCLAMTATATPRVSQDIIDNLGIKTCKKFIGSFNRPNLYYEVIEKTKPVEQTIDFLNRFRGQSGIIYCFSRRQVDELTDELNEEGFKALPYHAGLPDHIRAHNQDRFIRDDIPIMVATIAFGMGINKPNVRFVVHFDLPKNIESYYQETGRAGRDGLPANCLLLFGYGDIRKIRYFIDQKESNQEKRVAKMHLNAMVHYGEAKNCRRIPLITYFGEDYTIQQCGHCDNCVNPKEATFNMTMVAQKFFKCVMETGQRFGAMHVIDVLRGSQSQKVLNYSHDHLEVHGAGKEFSLRQWQFLIRQFLQQGLLLKEEEYSVLSLNRKSRAVLYGREEVLGFSPPADRIKSKAVKPVVEGDIDQKLFDILRAKRKSVADAQGVPPYVVFPDKSLIEMSTSFPETKDQFSGIFGVGSKKLEAYGDIFIQVIKEYCLQKEDTSISPN